MGSAAVLVALIVLVVGGYVGWQLRHAYGANSDLKVHKTRIPNFRKTRNRSWLTSLALIVITLFVPCIASLMVMMKERGWREGFVIWIGTWVMAFLVGGIVSQVVLKPI